MTTIKEINEEMDRLLSEVDEEGALEEINEKYAAFDKNKKALLESADLESYLKKYEEMNREDDGALRCFNLDTSQELTDYIADKEISFDDLKTETVQASCEALKFAIYDSIEDDDY